VNSENELERLTEVYRNMADGQLEKLEGEAASLTAVAREVLGLELSRRGLEVELQDSAPPESDDAPKLVTLKQYVTLQDALLAKSVLDSAGIESFLADQNVIRLDWFLSNALGGIKLRVRREDAAAALGLLGSGLIEPREEEGDA
jgi:hypothetical protein